LQHRSKTILAFFVLLALAACSMWATKATVTYEGVGDMLLQTYTNAKAMCDAGTLTPEQCSKLKDAYNKARDAYIAAGDTLVLIINTEAAIHDTHDAVKQQELQQLTNQYVGLLQQAGNLAIEFQNLYCEFGGKQK
jgi:hypothetical protein